MSLLIEALRRAEQAKNQQNQSVKQQDSPQPRAGKKTGTEASPVSDTPAPEAPGEGKEEAFQEEDLAGEPVELAFDWSSELSRSGEDIADENGQASSEDKPGPGEQSELPLSLLDEEAFPPSETTPSLEEMERHWSEGGLFELLDETAEPAPASPEIAVSEKSGGGELPRPVIHHEEILEFLDEEPEAPAATDSPPATEPTPSDVSADAPEPENVPQQDDPPPPTRAAPSAVNPISGDGRLKPKVPVSRAELQDEAASPDEKPLQDGEGEQATRDREAETAREILRADSRGAARDRQPGLYGLLLLLLFLLLAAGGGYYYLEVYQGGFSSPVPATRTSSLAASPPARTSARGEPVPSSGPGQNRQSPPRPEQNPTLEPARNLEPPPELSLAETPELTPPAAEPNPETAQIERVMPPEEPQTEKSELELESPPLTPVPNSGLEIQRQESGADLPRQLARAYAAYQQGDWEQARNFYAASLAEDARNRDALLGLAALAARRGDTRAARAYYRQVERLYPDDPIAALELATLDTEQSPEQQETRLKTLIADQPESAPLHFALGNLYRRQSRWREAQQAYFEAYRHHDTQPDYAYNLAVSLDHLGKTGPALNFYHRAMQLASTRAASFDRATVIRRIQVLNASNTP